MQRSSTVRQNALRVVRDTFALSRPQLVTPSSASLGTSAPASDLPLERAYHWERTRPDAIFLTQPLEGKVLNWSWAGAMSEARRMATYLAAQNWPRGSHIVILGRNSPWWIMAELAIWMSGHVTVPIYTSLTEAAARQLFAHTDAVACFVGSLDNAGLVPEIVAPELLCIRFRNAPTTHGALWDSLVAEHDPIAGNPARQPDELGTIIYTSGTTGSPKGVMHRFGAFPHFVNAVTVVTGKEPGKRVFSYLPLAHIAERAVTELAGMSMGWQIFFCEKTATFLADLRLARPTFFFSVPRLYAKFQADVLHKIPQRRLHWLLRVPIVNRIVRRRILQKLGLGSVRTAASGSAPLALDLLLWFRRLGLALAEGYGTTEIGITHTAPGGQGLAGYVGRSAPGVVTEISSDGEVLVRSPMNMLGYYKDEQATREVFTEHGFLRTGDLGEVNADGWLKIIGRLKEQFKTSKGKYVLPSGIECMLNAHDAIESSLVMGSGLPAPFAVAVLSPEAEQAAQSETGRASLAPPLEELIRVTNSRLAPHEWLKFLVLVNERWSIETGFLTPTLKMKRSVLEAHYAPLISQWVNQDSMLIWHIKGT